MTNIDHFLFFGLRKDEIDVSGNIILSHMVESEIPVFLIIDRQVHVFVGVDSATVVSKPNIMALVSQDACGCLVWRVKEPSACDVNQTMLEEDWQEVVVVLRAFRIEDVPDVKDVAIWSGDIKLLEL